MREGSSPRFNVLGTILLDEIAGGLCRHGAITPGFAADKAAAWRVHSLRQGSSLARMEASSQGEASWCLVVGQQIIVPKNLEQRPSELSLIVVTDLVVPHWFSSPIRS